MHDNVPDNILKHTSFALGDESFDEAVKEKGLILVDQTYDTQRVQHCHIELPVSFAYQDGNGKITVTTSTQIPHIVRRVIGQALGIPWGQVRVIKPYIGGGFGNKQDVLYEPLNAFSYRSDNIIRLTAECFLKSASGRSSGETGTDQRRNICGYKSASCDPFSYAGSCKTGRYTGGQKSRSFF